MWQDYLGDPGLVDKYGYNSPNEYWMRLKFGLIELIFLYLMLNPWMTQLVILRILVALVICFCWTCLFGLASMHGGGMATIHLLWLLAVNIALLAGLFGKMFQIDMKKHR
jgi:fatty acid desaturase